MNKNMKHIPYLLPLALVCIAGLFFFWAQGHPVSAAQDAQTVLRPAQMGSANYALDWSSLGSGGGETVSSHYTLSSSIGGLAAGNSASVNYAGCSGFECVRRFLHVYLPLIVR